MLQAFVIGWQSLCFLSITILIPQSLLPMGVTGSILGTGLTAAAVLNGRGAWLKLSSFGLWFMFFVLLISQAVDGTIEEYLPITLLQFIMVLASVELLTSGNWYRTGASVRLSEVASPAELSASIDGVVRNASRRIFRLALLFASCYLVSLGVLYLTTFATITASLLVDISLYIVLVSVALALLILSRESRTQL